MDLILKKAYHKVIEDEKFVKLTVLSLLPYSLLFVIYLFDQTYFILTSLNNWVQWNELKLYIENIFSIWENYLFLLIVLVVIILAIYYFIPPIAEAALIYYLEKWNSISSALWKWLIKFFSMFELHWFLSLFSFLLFFIVVSRLYILDMLDPNFVIPLIFIWLLFIVFFNFTTVYAKYLIVLENYSAFDAIKYSIKLTFLNFKISFKWYLIYIFLYVRVIINIIILIWIPLIILYLFLKSNISNIDLVKYSIYIVIFVLFLLTAYINWIIESFFVAMWYEIFKKIEYKK